MGRQATVLLIFLQIATSQPQTRGDWDIQRFHVNTTVTCRYAITVITSHVFNRHDDSTEIDFHVKIPKNAFISKFRMTIDGKIYDGVVKPKEEARQQYITAVSRGQSGGLVSAVGRTLEDFKTSVSVAAYSKVTFELTYEELLQRRLGKYELLINAQPGQPVKDFKIDVSLYEKPGISFLKVEGSLASNDLASAITKSHADEKAWVNFYPTHNQQITCDGCAENGLSGDLKIIFDVERPHSKGDIREYGGFFVHYFAPTGLPRIPKNVVFIIDQSGSMAGKKIEQTRTALLKILGDLDGDDHFGLICFDDQISPWKRELLRATQQNLDNAKEFVRTITDRGSTDINAAVLEGVNMIKNSHKEGSASILILLTDGDPTSGETRPERIQSNVREAIGKRFPLYCLGFGFDVNFEFLQKMAQENSGVARRIYQDSDAALQLKGFYEEVAVPLLTSVQMNYSGAANLTQTSFSYYYNGSEIVVAGQITDINDFSTEVIGKSADSKVTYSDVKPIDDDKLSAEMSGFENFLQRLWACLKVKQLLEKELVLTSDEKEAVKKEALDLSLKYSFVTPLTSMVVTKPEGEDSHVANKPKEGDTSGDDAGHSHDSGHVKRIYYDDWGFLEQVEDDDEEDMDVEEEDEEGYDPVISFLKSRHSHDSGHVTTSDTIGSAYGQLLSVLLGFGACLFVGLLIASILGFKGRKHSRPSHANHDNGDSPSINPGSCKNLGAEGVTYMDNSAATVERTHGQPDAQDIKEIDNHGCCQRKKEN
ncbi:inter-alpha-trypsin inhibitor heavy chain H3-like isoform X2 [Alosa alosa]|uniref:inter-alpha-trypsin inhibitor heavy chain H3-like isoform X2 n=1 Tax=Alosa alosa TaxID=278164 RepID=UPI0020153721|nr:inter-alpha-trypsin inhibitor heavy chain H3-like isoform X2 [Alosa alosa]